MSDKKRYETPTVQTLTGGQVLEFMGPAQGYMNRDGDLLPEGSMRIRSSSRLVRD